MGPLIGIVAHPTTVEEAGFQAPHAVTNLAYVKAVRKAGGVPVLLPAVEPGDAPGLVARVDGVILTGGVDLDPAGYGQDPHPETGPVDPVRDALEVASARAAVEQDKALLAICRGIQVLNVALGGTLVQHVDKHSDLDRYNEVVHPVTVAEGSVLSSWLGGATELDVNTLHHQAVDEPAPGCRAVAWAHDGTIEAIEVDGSRSGASRAVGVQWHPELLRHLPQHLQLFRALVAAASA